VLEPLADKLGAALGASRDRRCRQLRTRRLAGRPFGKIVARHIGISGIHQHLAGMKDSKVATISSGT
jgi:electron transfer flavoprotein alpha subunit